MNRFWRCTVCGYIHKGLAPPEKCPNCGAPKEKFIEVEPNFEEFHLFYGQKVSYGKEVDVNPFFGDFSAIAPYIYNLPVGKKVKLHKHPTTDELFFVIRGKVKFQVAGKEIIAKEGDLVKGPMDIPHSFENISEEPVIFLSVKAPKPVDLVWLE